MQATMECPRCGQENSRALQHCCACGEWLHGRSAVVGACRNCRLPVRQTEVACSNCGAYLKGRPKEHRGPRLRDETSRGDQARRSAARLVRRGARILSGAFACSAAGMVVLAVAAAGGIMALQDYRRALTPDDAFFAFYAMMLWLVAGAVGVALLAIGVFVLRPGP